jgi:FMN phosphatase YigB (HAD superfamily)
MGVAPERSLYVGDIRSVDEAGAHAAGMPFTLVDPFGDYAGDPAARVARMDELPGHVAARFATPVPGIRTPQ